MIETEVLPESGSRIRPVERWKRVSLLISGIHCVVWGIFVIIFPSKSALVYGFSAPLHDDFLWQGTGLIILLMGIGYCIASSDPSRHFLVVLVGLLAQVLGPIGLLWTVWLGTIPAEVLLLIPVNDMIWWYPFTRIVIDGFRRS